MIEDLHQINFESCKLFYTNYVSHTSFQKGKLSGKKGNVHTICYQGLAINC